MLRKLQKTEHRDPNEVVFKVMCCPVPLNLDLINPFFIPARITRLKKMAQSIWKQSLPKNTRFNPEASPFSWEATSWKFAFGGYYLLLPSTYLSKNLERKAEPFQLEFLDYRSLQVALLRTIKLTREVYRFTGYLGLFVLKISLENIAGKGLDDPKFFSFYIKAPEPQCTYNDIILPYGFYPLEARAMENPRQVADPILGYIYRCFGFEALDSHSITRAELAR
ncbi:hypothetical protein N752_23550 [Desulforamulus aquiferis]|nr:hypothetical protein [Desulforamulus aquiferis]RYD02759.1 hypothetical protein N752_23550 [Desulforamulus aquiferis]